MNQAKAPQLTELPGTWPMLRAMGGVGILCSLLIVSTYQATLPVIERNKAEALEKAVFEVLPGTETKIDFRIMPDGRIEHAGTVTKGERIVYAGYDAQQNLTGIAIEAQGQGFQDVIRILYGFSPAQQTVIGFQVLESKETPGLGDKIEKDDDFLRNFAALDVALRADKSAVKNPVIPVKKGEKANPWEVECITGATISSKAIANILQSNTGDIIPVIMQNLAVFEAGPQQLTLVQKEMSGK